MAKKKILIVDDDSEFTAELKELLSLSGYEAEAVNESIKTFEVVRVFKPDVIVLDIKMSGMDGFRVLEKLKESSDTAKIQVIIMTGYFTNEEHSRLMSMCGVNACLKKPFNALDLIARIEVAQDNP